MSDLPRLVAELNAQKTVKKSHHHHRKHRRHKKRS